MLLAEKRKGVSQTQNIFGICSYCVLDRPVFQWNQVVLHPELTLWWSVLNANGAQHKKPHSPTHPMDVMGYRQKCYHEIIKIKMNYSA